LDFQTSSTEFGPSSSRPVALSDATRSRTPGPNAVTIRR
jgi:hypothetical protein